MSTLASHEEGLSKDLAAFDELLAIVTQACTPILEIRVTDSASEQQALSAAGQISTLLKRVETRRKDLLVPLREQVERINAAAKKVEAALEPSRAHVDQQRRLYADELARKKAEALRIQREKEEAELRAAAEKRAREEAELRAKQEAERKAQAETARLEAEQVAREAEAQARAKAQAASLFGGASDAAEKARIQAERVKREAEEKAAADVKALADQQERERIAEEARRQREEDERQKKLEDERKAIEAQRVKGSRVDYEVEITDVWAIPREFLNDPKPKLADLKAARKAGRLEIPGVVFREVTKIAVRSQPLDVSA